MPSRKFRVCTTFHDTMPPGRMPQFTSERPNTASSAAIARSQAQTWVKPPPKQKPLTMAMVGLGIARQVVERVVHVEMELRAHGVALVRPVHDQPGDPVILLDQDGLVFL